MTSGEPSGDDDVDESSCVQCFNKAMAWLTTRHRSLISDFYGQVPDETISHDMLLVPCRAMSYGEITRLIFGSVLRRCYVPK